MLTTKNSMQISNNSVASARSRENSWLSVSANFVVVLVCAQMFQGGMRNLTWVF